MNLTAKQQLRRNVDNGGYAAPTKTYSVPASENDDKTISVPASPVFGIDPNHEPIDLYMPVRTNDGGLIRDIALIGGIGAGGRTIVCPAGKRWRPVSLIWELTCTATVGNRLLQCRAQNVGGGALWVGTASTTVTATQVGGYDVSFGNAGAPSTVVRRNFANTGNTNVQVRDLWGVTTMKAGDMFLLEDSADIDAADSVEYHFVAVEYDA